MCFCLTHKYINFTYVVFILLCVVVNELQENENLQKVPYG